MVQRTLQREQKVPGVIKDYEGWHPSRKWVWIGGLLPFSTRVQPDRNLSVGTLLHVQRKFWIDLAWLSSSSTQIPDETL